MLNAGHLKKKLRTRRSLNETTFKQRENDSAERNADQIAK